MRYYIILIFSFCIYIGDPLLASEVDKLNPKIQSWPFDGPFGKFDREAAQRGFKVYKEVCSACHSMNHLTYRNLKEIGFSEQEIKSLASEYQVSDGPNEVGDMFQRPALPSDRFLSPYPNEKSARASNNGAYPPDLSLIIKAREDGANYVFSILTGYKEAPENFNLTSGLYYNPYFPHMQIAMPQPLSDGQVSFDDNSPSSLDQMARDVVIFLQWAAEPEMENRKSMGIKVFIFLIFFTIFFYIAKRRIWKDIE
jgi:ubiquinol-cytochrome c reductase cytochrome c1 subunit